MARRTFAATVLAALLLNAAPAPAAAAGASSAAPTAAGASSAAPTAAGARAAAPAQTCSTTGSIAVTGGFRVTLNCAGAGFVVGFGSTLTAANQQALQLYQLFLNTGRDCSSTSATTEPGGFEVTLLCTAPDQWVEAYGTTLTDAAEEARTLALLPRNIGRQCDGSSVTTVPGGYEATLLCNAPEQWVEGYGTTLSAAADEARELVLLSTSLGRQCDGSSVLRIPGGYEATLFCTRPDRWYEGAGTTLTEAAQTARFLVTLG